MARSANEAGDGAQAAPRMKVGIGLGVPRLSTSARQHVNLHAELNADVREVNPISHLGWAGVGATAIIAIFASADRATVHAQVVATSGAA